MYKAKLIMLLKALEVRDIDELIEKPPGTLAAVGIVIAKAAKRGGMITSRCKGCGGIFVPEVRCHDCRNLPSTD